MPTLIYADGFEHQSTSVNDFGAADGNGVFDSLTGVPTIVTTSPRTGAAALQCSPAAAILLATKFVPGTDPAIVVASFYIKFTTLPDGDADLWSFDVASGQNARLFWRSASGKFNVSFSTGPGSPDAANDVGPVVSADVWYLVDLKVDVSANPGTLDGQIDGSANVQDTVAQAASTILSCRFGQDATTVTYTAQYDDFVMSKTAADYPLGAHKVLPLHLNGDGTHSFSPTGDFLRTATSMAQSDTNGWLEIDDWITGAASDADYIATALAAGTEYTEFTLDDTTETTIWLATAWGAMRAAATQACLTIVRLVDSGGSQVGDIYNGDPSETALHFRNINGNSVPALINPTPSTVNGYKLRVFGTNDVNPDPWLAAVMLQIAVPDAGGTPVTVAVLIGDVVADGATPTISVQKQVTVVALVGDISADGPTPSVQISTPATVASLAGDVVVDGTISTVVVGTGTSIISLVGDAASDSPDHTVARDFELTSDPADANAEGSIPTIIAETGGGVSATVVVPIGDAAEDGTLPAISAGLTVGTPVGDAPSDGLVVTVSAGATLSSLAGDGSADGPRPTVFTGTIIQAGVGDVLADGPTPAVSAQASRIITSPVGDMASDGPRPAVVSGASATVAARVGDAAADGLLVIPSIGPTITFQPGDIVADAPAPTLSAESILAIPVVDATADGLTVTLFLQVPGEPIPVALAPRGRDTQVAPAGRDAELASAGRDTQVEARGRGGTV